MSNNNNSYNLIDSVCAAAPQSHINVNQKTLRETESHSHTGNNCTCFCSLKAQTTFARTSCHNSRRQNNKHRVSVQHLKHITRRALEYQTLALCRVLDCISVGGCFQRKSTISSQESVFPWAELHREHSCLISTVPSQACRNKLHYEFETTTERR